MSTALDLARFALACLAVGYLAAFIAAGAVLGIKAGLCVAGPLRLTTERTTAIRIGPDEDRGA